MGAIGTEVFKLKSYIYNIHMIEIERGVKSMKIDGLIMLGETGF